MTSVRTGTSGDRLLKNTADLSGEVDPEVIEIRTTNYSSKFFCPICGMETTDAKGSVVKCDHLVFLGTEEGTEFSICDDVEEPEDDDEWMQYDAQLKEFRKTLDDEHLCIHVDIPAPSFATYCIIYNLHKVSRSTGPVN